MSERSGAAVPAFRYESFSTDAEAGLLTCRYSLGDCQFTERVTLQPGARWHEPQAQAAARLVFLLAGVSYYKTAAPPVIDLGDMPLSDAEHSFLLRFYLDGLGEYAYRNQLDLSGLQLRARPAPPAQPAPAEPLAPAAGRPLIPFGGGIDSIVTVEKIRARHPAAALFVVSRPGARFDAIEAPAAVAGLPVIRAGREIDPQLMRSAELGFRNGHVPVTGIISAIGILAAVLDGRDALVMSNEWSASVPTLEHDGRPVNHQWSKGEQFEQSFAELLRQAGLPGYFSALRDRTELWVGEEFARLAPYHATFRSCNRAFHLDPARRLDHWCGECDKCCFIDLILAPFMPAQALRGVFGPVPEPLSRPELAAKFGALLGSGTKPFECVGEVNECRAALLLAAARPDRAGEQLLASLAAEVARRPDAPSQAEIAAMRRPAGRNFVPDGYAFEPPA